MRVTDTLALAADVVVVKIADLPSRVREELGDDGAFAVTRARGRSPSVLVDEAAGRLLGEFREPSTIVASVLRYSAAHGLDPEQVLTDAYPTLRRFMNGGYLVTDGVGQASDDDVAFAPGEAVAGGVVARIVRVLEDTELYQLATSDGGVAALKVLRDRRHDGLAGAALHREASALRLIDGAVAPRLLGEGAAKGHPWLLTEWCAGTPLTTAAAALRRASSSDEDWLALSRRLVAAYVTLHGLGIVHGDVHPGNIIVTPTGDVCLLDFGLSVLPAQADSTAPPRGGVQAFLDPRHAEALTAGQPAPPATFASDQYSLGAVLYQTLTGASYTDIALDNATALRQIADDSPLPFTRRGRPAWPALEALLATALAKRPTERFSDTAALADALERIRPESSARAGTGRTALDVRLNEMLQLVRPGGDWFANGVPAAPYCSVAYGAAGIASALHRVATVRSDPELIVLADEWVRRAEREAGRVDAFTNDAITLSADRTGLISPFHQLSGVHTVQALIGHALGDVLSRQRALDAFVDASRHRCDSLDLTLGRAGTVLAAAILLETIGSAPYCDSRRVLDLGRRTLAEIWTSLDAMPPIGDPASLRYLGVAHGWAGLLLTTLRWQRVTREAAPTGLLDRLDQLADLARTDGLGASWPWLVEADGGGRAMAGWCNGSAGFVHLWTTAHAELGHQRWAALAERAAWSSYTSHMRLGQLCCGLAGQAYALLALYSHTGETRWRKLAGELASRAAVDPASTNGLNVASLHKGVVGVAVLAADLAAPEDAAMPVFGIAG
jgi:eukaryotic-like serine/threonine-protein kinase